MARKTTKRPAPAARRPEFQPRALLLAGIGAVSLGRKQAIRSYAQAVEGIDELRTRAGTAVHDAELAARKLKKQAEGKVLKFQKQAQAKIAPVQKKALALANEAKAQAETRLAPVLAKLGVKPAPAKRRSTRKPAAKRPAKRATRRAA